MKISIPRANSLNLETDESRWKPDLENKVCGVGMGDSIRFSSLQNRLFSETILGVSILFQRRIGQPESTHFLTLCSIVSHSLPKFQVNKGK